MSHLLGIDLELSFHYSTIILKGVCACVHLCVHVCVCVCVCAHTNTHTVMYAMVLLYKNVLNSSINNEDFV